MNKAIPWSELEEKRLLRILLCDLIVILLLAIGGIALTAAKVWPCVAIDFAGACFYVIDIYAQWAKLQAMLQNKPRSTVGLTTWIRMRPYQTEICCACGAVVHIDGAPWFPNPVDPGGGRYSIVCPCGIGYFKLKA